MNKVTQYFKDAYGELKKVIWPTKKQTRDYTLIVIGLSLGTALFFALLDYAFDLILSKVI